MIHFIKGKLAMHIHGGVVIENNGIGYEISIPDNSSVYKASEGDTVMIYTAMTVREDDISLYGFDNKELLYMFNKLISVSGVGAKAGLSILSSMPLDNLKKAIAFEDASTLTKANGIGKKIAQRIVLELKDKIQIGDSDYKEISSNVENSDNKTEAVNALISLGYSKGEAIMALSKISGELTVEEYIKKALKSLF